MSFQTRFSKLLDEATGTRMPNWMRGYGYGGRSTSKRYYYQPEPSTQMVTDTRLGTLRAAYEAKDRSETGIMIMLGNPSVASLGTGRAVLPDPMEESTILTTPITEAVLPAGITIEIFKQDPTSGINIYKLTLPKAGIDAGYAERYVAKKIEIRPGEDFNKAAKRIQDEISNEVAQYIGLIQHNKQLNHNDKMVALQQKLLDTFGSQANAEKDLAIIKAEAEAVETLTNIGVRTVETWAKNHGIPNREDITKLFGITSPSSLVAFAKRFMVDIAALVPRWKELGGVKIDRSKLFSAISKVNVNYRMVDFMMDSYGIPNKITPYAAQALAALTMVGGAAIICADESMPAPAASEAGAGAGA